MKLNPIFCKECYCWGKDTRCNNLVSLFYGILKAPLDSCSCFIDNGNRRLVARKEGDICNSEIEFTVYERKPYQKKTRVLVETEDEEFACRIPKGG